MKDLKDLKDLNDPENNEIGKKLFSALNDIDDGLLNEALEYRANEQKAQNKQSPRSPRKINFRLRRVLISAAALVLIASLLIVSFAIKPGSDRDDNNTANTTPGTLTQFTGSAYSNDESADLPSELGNIKVRTDGSTPYLLPENGRLIIEADSDCSVETLTKYVTITPNTDMSVKKLADGQYELTPASGGFNANTVYKVTVGSPTDPAASYAFQTETEVCIKSILPADRAVDVPCNTGIEVTFTESVKDNDFSKYIKIAPETDGKFTVYPDGRTVAFVPDKGLDYTTYYTVEVKEGIKGISGKSLKEGTKICFVTSDGNTSNGNSDYVYFHTSQSLYDLTAVYSSSDTIGIPLYVYGPGVDAYHDRTVNASVYKYKSFSDAEKALTEYIQSKNGGTLSEKGLQLVNEFSYTVNGDVDYSLGSGYEGGVYLVKINANAYTASGKELKADDTLLFQVTDLRAFFYSSDGKAVMQLCEKGTGAVNGAKISGSLFKTLGKSGEDFSSVSASTDKNGLCEIESKDKDSAVIKAESASSALLCLTAFEKTDDVRRYLSTVYTDREVYFSNDKINFRLFAFPSYDNVAPLSDIYLETGLSAQRIRIHSDEEGTFSGSFDVENVSGGGTFLRFSDGNGTVIAYKYVRITEEEKPKITAGITFDKLFYRYGETVTATLTASFFDGTPAEGFEFTFSCYPFSDELSEYIGKSPYVTDKNGQIQIKLQTGYVKAYSTSPISINLHAELTGMETQRLNTYSSVMYFHSDYIFDHEYDDDCVRLKLNYRNTDAIKTADDLKYGAFPANTVGAPANGTVHCELKKIYYVSHEKSEYDPYTKKNNTYTVYDRREATLKTETLSFKNGVIELPVFEAKDYEEYYYYEVSFNDGRNKFTISPNASRYKRYSYGSFFSEGTALILDKEKATVGETVKANLVTKLAPVDDVLFILLSDGIHDVSVCTDYDFVFDKTMVPSALLNAIHFNKQTGSFYYRSQSVFYDYERAAALTPVITADKSQYLPGETAVLKIKADGAANGNALVSIVDEACFALGEQNEETANSLFNMSRYEYYYFSSYYKRTESAFRPALANARRNIFYLGITTNGMYAESALASDSAVKNGGSAGRSVDSADGWYIRKYFADNPEFKIVSLDENGEGVLVFTVPDNLTSWRATVSVISGEENGIEGLRAGSSTSGVLCTMPFFISLNASASYIAGDDAVLAARSYGAGADGTVSYTAVLTDENGKEINTISSDSLPLTQAQFNFGKLSEGHYKLTVMGSCNDHRDALEQEFDVIKSASVTKVSKTIGINEISDIKPALYPVNLTFCDNNALNGIYGDLIRSAGYFKNGGERADSIASEYAILCAYDKLNGTDSSEQLEELKARFTSYVKSSGEVKLLPYGSADIELTAGIFALAPDLFDAKLSSALISECYNRISGSTLKSKEELGAMMLILSSAGEPVLDRLYEIYSASGDCPTNAKLYLAASFAALGDYSAANSILKDISKEYGVSDEEYGTLYFKGDTTDESIRMNSIAVYAASRVSKKAADALVKYLAETNSKTESSELARAYYVKYFTPEGEYAEKKAVLKIGGETREITVKGGMREHLTLSKSELAAFEVISADDGITVIATYSAPSGSLSTVSQSTDRLSVKKTITHYRGDIYKVTLDISGKSTRRYESFSISDMIPSGARYYSSLNEGFTEKKYNGISIWAYAHNTSGQKIHGNVTVHNNNSTQDSEICDEYEFNASVSYYIRGALYGSFVVESATVSVFETERYAKSDRMTLFITEDGEWKTEPLKQI